MSDDMKTRLSSILLAAVLVVVAASPAAADDDDGKVRLLTRETATVTAGDTAWLAMNWTAEDVDVQDFSLVLRQEPKDGVTVTYPENTATFTGLMNGHYLDDGEIDFTAVQVHVPADFDKKHVNLKFTVNYTVTGGDDGDDDDDEDEGRDGTRTQNVTVKVPVVQHNGDHLVQHDAAVEVAPGSTTWVDVDFTGLAPMVEDLEMTVAGDATIVYPGYGSSTSLHGDDVLEDGETDTARFRIDAGDTAGTHELTTEISYTVAGERFSRSGSVTVTIAG